MMTLRTKIVVTTTVIFLVYIVSYTQMRGRGNVEAAQNGYSGMYYIDVRNEPSTQRYALLFGLHILYWPANQMDRLLFNGREHSSTLPMYRLGG